MKSQYNPTTPMRAENGNGMNQEYKNLCKLASKESKEYGMTDSAKTESEAESSGCGANQCQFLAELDAKKLYLTGTSISR